MKRGASASEVARLAGVVDALLAHCPDPECARCGEAVCPHGDWLHFHHDGCPSCHFEEDASHETRLRESLSDHEIDAIAEAMPGGLDGFLKGWGWRQFARAIEDAVHAKPEALPLFDGAEAGGSDEKGEGS